MKKAIFPGSFNPFHDGHLSILQKALKIFDIVYLIISYNPDKRFDHNNFDERLKNVKKHLNNFENIEIIINKNELIANIAEKLKIDFLIRSARNSEDFDYELLLSNENKNLNHNLETILILPDENKIKFNSTKEREYRNIK